MFKKKKEIPAYFFTGFLESGKTSFIKETMREGQFQDGLKTLLIVCEEGIEEFTDQELKENMFTLKVIEEEEDFTFGALNDLDDEVKPDRVMIEYNGTWDPDTAMELMPEHWVLAEGIATVDAATYDSYLNNMKQMMTRQFTYADLVVFNRCSDDMDLPYYKRTVRAINRRAQVMFEMADGTINNDIKEELPYDINADVITVEDDDYGIWYLDTFDNLDSYAGKAVRFKGMVRKPRNGKNDFFVPGRMAMTCCAADIQFVGLPCKYDKVGNLKEKEYVMVTARVGKVFNKQYGQDTPVLYAESVEPCEPAAEEVVYF